MLKLLTIHGKETAVFREREDALNEQVRNMVPHPPTFKFGCQLGHHCTWKIKTLICPLLFLSLIYTCRCVYNKISTLPYYFYLLFMWEKSLCCGTHIVSVVSIFNSLVGAAQSRKNINTHSLLLSFYLLFFLYISFVCKKTRNWQGPSTCLYVLFFFFFNNNERTHESH